MPTFHVQPGGNPRLAIYSPRDGVRIRFADGRYDTDDPAEIRALRRNRSCFELDELRRDLERPSEFDRPATDEDDDDERLPAPH